MLTLLTFLKFGSYFSCIVASFIYYCSIVVYTATQRRYKQMQAINEIETKVNNAAEQMGLINFGFNNLSLKDRCLGLAVLSCAAGEIEAQKIFQEMYDFLN
jgi:ABC-type phosphate transport system auxiliary subunit